jgi:anthranilate synthase component I
VRQPRRVPLPVFLAPNQLYERLRRRHRHAFLLESRGGPRRLARYSLIGFGPREFFQDRKGADPLPLAREVVRQHRVDDHRGFPGGLVGAVAYDAVHHFDAPSHRRRAPHFLLGLYTDAVIFNHLEGRVSYVTLEEDRSQDVLEAAEERPVPPQPLRIGRIRTNTGRDDFYAMVRETQRRIRDGETYQTVLSRRFDAPYRGDLGALYDEIRVRNPSPYMYDLDFGATRILGSSPEMLVRVERGQVETFPIAGTRPLGKSPRHDALLKRELLADPKENAEHIMLVDLARNDVGRVSRIGTVRVPEYRKIESYSSVHHMVSRVTGRLRRGLDGFDAFRSIFPAGTVSGAPKIRAMQIIDELEKDPRGFYAGSVCYFGLNGDLDSAITIRSLVAHAGRLSVQAGAGIVADSRPEQELAETTHKAASILGFLGRNGS